MANYHLLNETFEDYKLHEVLHNTHTKSNQCNGCDVIFQPRRASDHGGNDLDQPGHEPDSEQ